MLKYFKKQFRLQIWIKERRDAILDEYKQDKISGIEAVQRLHDLGYADPWGIIARFY